MTVWACGRVGVWGNPSAGIPGEGGVGAGHGSGLPAPEDARDSHTPTPPHPHTAGPAIPPSAVLAWLDARTEPPPPELRQRMAEALAAAQAETVPGALAESALACLQATVEQPQGRASALDLLAADALLTYALEAAAELGAETLRRITTEYGPEALGRALPEERDE